MKTIDNPLFLLKTIVRPFSFALLTMLVSLSNYAQLVAGSAALEDHTSVFTPLHREDLSLKKDPSTGFMPDLSLLDQPMKREVTETQRKQIAQNIAALPISFRKNMGQWDNNIIYRGSSPGWNANINFMKNGLSFGFLHEKEIPDIKTTSPGEEDVECLVWNLNFKGANTDARITAEGKENSHISYIYNIDVDKQQLNVPDYRMISYNNIYDNIDLRYYNAGKELKYDYIVQPGGDMSRIQMNCVGIEKLTINNKGQLEIKTVLGTLLEEIPESYQIINGVKKQVKIHYKLIDQTTFCFYTNERYSTSEPLVIDPVTLAWCTMLGPAGDGSSYMQDIAIDAASNVYGVTDGTPLYPTTPGAYSTGVFLRGYDTYVFKFNSTATTLIWGTFVSTGRGNNTSDKRSIALDAQNNVYIVGRTCPACGGGGGNLITTPGAYDVTYNGPAAGSGNAYFLKLNNAGSTLLYSSYLGSASAMDAGLDIKVSSTGLIYVTGGTQGPSFPVTAGAFDVTHNGGSDIFLSVINPAGAGAADLVYSTFIGGTGAESGLSLAIDPLGRACITGQTSSGNFPTTVGSYNTVFGGATDAFACKINPGGAGLADMVYSTFIGGTSGDGGTGIVVNAAGEAFLTGNTASTNFPVTAGAYDVAYGGTGAIFALKLNVSGTTLLYSTYIEGISGSDIALSSASCDNNEVFISASAGTSPPITSCAYRSTAPGGGDVIVLKLKMAGGGISDLLYLTYFGGNAQDYNNSPFPICANAQDEVFVAYTTHSSNTPTTAGVFGPNPGGTPNDISVVFKLKPSLATLNYTFAIGACNNTVNFTGTASGTCIWQQTWTPNYWKWDFGDGQTSNLQNPVHVYGSPGTYNVKLIVGCPKDSITKTVIISPTVTVTTSLTNSSCAASNGTGTAMPAGGSSPYTYSWSNGQTTGTATGLSAGTYTVAVRDANGCIGQKTITINASGTLTAGITPTNKTCTVAGSAISTPSGGTPGYTYSWSNGQTTQTATNLSAGTYTVKITDAAGCSLTQSVSITQPAAIVPVISSGKQATCGLNNGNSTVTTSGGTAPYTYNWNNGQTTQTATGLGAGNYTVTVRDANGCSSTQKAVITTIPPSSFTVTSTNGTCGNGGSATVTATGGTIPFTYSWSGMSQTTNSVSAISAGNYTIMVTDANGCSSTKTVTITDTPSLASATFTVSPGTTVCVGTPVTFTNTGTTGTYNWVISTITPANVSGTTVDFSYTFLTIGTYSVSHTVTTSGCSKNVVTPITVTVCSGSPSATATGSSVCPGTCATATSSATGGTAPYTYSWNNGATTQNISPCPASTTTYTVTIRDSGGNTSTSTAVVTVNPVVTVSVTPTNIVCNGGSGSASATGSSGTTPYTYTWGGGISGSTISGLSPGTYTVTITDNKGCTATNTTTIVAPQPLTGQFTKGTANCVGCGCKEWIMVNATGGTSPYSYTWSDGYVNRYKNRVCPDTYTINVTDKNGCSINVNLTAP